MAFARTTRCCVWLFTALASLALGAQTPPSPPLALFPVRALWDLPLDSTLVVPPAFAGSRGYFALETRRLVAYELTRGTPLWTADAQPQAALTIGGGLLFMAEDGGVSARDEDTGAVRWRVPLTDPLVAPLVWDNGWLIATTSSASVLAFRARDGQLVWHQELPAAATGAPALAADRVYVAAKDSRVYALQIESGTTLWNRHIGGVPGDLVASDDRVYIGSTDNYLYCLLAKNGAVDWRWPTGGDIVGTPVLAEGHVYFASLDNLLRALDARSGGQLWKRVLAIRPTRGPVAAGRVLFMSGNTPGSPAFDMKTGAPAGEIAAGGLLYAAPHYIADRGLPAVAFAIRDLAHGAIVKAMVRSVEPATPAIAPLPNPILPTPPAPVGISEAEPPSAEP